MTAPAACGGCAYGQYVASVCTAASNISCVPRNDLVANDAYMGIGSAVGNCPWVWNSTFFYNSSTCSACGVPFQQLVQPPLQCQRDES